MKFTLLLCLVGYSSFAQEDVRIMEPINQLFEGMRRGDSAMVHRAFHPSAKLMAVTTDPNTKTSKLRGDRMEGWLKAIGTPHAQVWNEVIWSPRIEVDGDFAQVWAPFAFYLGTTLSHCGVDAFHLIRDGNGKWKIFHLADTHRVTGCEVPKEVSDRIK